MATDLLALTLLDTSRGIRCRCCCWLCATFWCAFGFWWSACCFLLQQKMNSKEICPDASLVLVLMHRIIVHCAWHCKQESNILSAKKQLQIFVLRRRCLANMAAMYAVYHGPEGLKNIAQRIALLTQIVAEEIEAKRF